MIDDRLCNLNTIALIIRKFNPETIILNHDQMAAVALAFTAQEFAAMRYEGPEGRGVIYNEVKIVRKPDPHGIVDLCDMKDSDEITKWREGEKIDG